MEEKKKQYRPKASQIGAQGSYNQNGEAEPSLNSSAVNQQVAYRDPQTRYNEQRSSNLQTNGKKKNDKERPVYQKEIRQQEQIVSRQQQQVQGPPNQMTNITTGYKGPSYSEMNEGLSKKKFESRHDKTEIDKRQSKAPKSSQDKSGMTQGSNRGQFQQQARGQREGNLESFEQNSARQTTARGNEDERPRGFMYTTRKLGNEEEKGANSRRHPRQAGQDNTAVYIQNNEQRVYRQNEEVKQRSQKQENNQASYRNQQPNQQQRRDSNNNNNHTRNFQAPQNQNNYNQRRPNNQNIHPSANPNSIHFDSQASATQNRYQNNDRRGAANERESDRFFSFKFLEQLETLSNEDLRLRLYSFKGLSSQINNTQFTYAIYGKLISLLHKIVLLEESETRNYILIAFKDSHFFANVDKEYLRNLTITSRTSQIYNERCQDLKKILEILEEAYIQRFRSQVSDFPISALKSFIKDGELRMLQRKFDPNNLTIGIIQELDEQVTKLHEQRLVILEDRVEENKGQEEEKKAARAQNQFRYDQTYLLEPPSDFQEINVVPEMRELLEIQRPFLRNIPERGQFRDCHDYLDCIFRLLHEDAIRPLREGIQVMRRQPQHGQNQKNWLQEIRNSQVKLFEDAQICDMKLQNDAYNITFRLNTKKLQRVNWLQAKKLMPGSLLVASPDRFQTIFVGIIRFKDSKKMNETAQRYNYVDIEVEIMSGNDPDLDSLVKFYLKNRYSQMTIIESAAYFESYVHVLQKIKKMDLWRNGIPLSRYFALADNELEHPLYIEKAFETLNLEYYIQQASRQAQLDPSQKEALYRCVQDNVALIQGPPGTGKTYVGQIFVKVLLQIKEAWKSRGPILMVCYTNHALDQFLNLIKQYTTNFVRIGGSCKDESLQQNCLREYSMANNIKLDRSFYEAKDEVYDIENKFRQIKSRICLTEIGIINTLLNQQDVNYILSLIKTQFAVVLKRTIREVFAEHEKLFSDKAFKRLVDAMQYDNDQIMVFWLGIVDLKKHLQVQRQILIDKFNQRAQNNELDLEDVYVDQEFDIDDFDQREQDIEEERKLQLQRIQNYRLDEQVNEKYGIFKNWYLPDQADNFYIRNGCQIYENCLDLGFHQGKEPNEFNEYQLFSLPIKTRWQINNSYLGQRETFKIELLDELAMDYKLKAKVKKEIEYGINSRALAKADIVALTTTGCAKYSDLLQTTKFPIVIVEEAAEVFEAHILSSLSKHTEHLILIGDHQQLKPNPAVYELEKKYNLNMSMFERLINNDFEHTTLQVQRRMRPEISKIIRLLYPNLEDAERVKQYPHIQGVSKDVFFFDHKKHESTNEGLMSKANNFEAEMIVNFTKYLLKQNYNHSKITILSLYMAQTLAIKRMLSLNVDKHSPQAQIKVVTVDNYQGEENDIIILSIVRSNDQNSIGYLKISNRVCVALSRAKHGLYIFGNSQCLVNSKAMRPDAEQQQNLWQQVVEYLKDNEFIGPKLVLKCKNHENIIEVEKVEDFQKTPEGGCRLICNVRVDCGHTCVNFCHPFIQTDEDKTGHKKYKCLKKCERAKPCSHPCSYQCYQCHNNQDICLPCQTEVKKTFLDCGDTIEVKCCNKTIATCNKPCKTVLGCGHKCPRQCGSRNQYGQKTCSEVVCKEQVQRRLPCGHEQLMDCYLSPQEHLEKYGCPVKCNAELECGHPCTNTCGQCFNNIFHGVCNKKCSKMLICGHICKENCTANCPSCAQKCETYCLHSKCNKLCREVCTPCNEPCKSSCKHTYCTKKCCEPCDREPCTMPCDKDLTCGHPCIGLCGDTCPQVCRVCQPDHETFQIFFGFEDDQESKFVQIDCGHIFERTSLDQWFSPDTKGGSIQFKECPKCKSQIKKTQRYQDYINQVFKDINEVKKIKLDVEEKQLQRADQMLNICTEYQKDVSSSIDISDWDRNMLNKFLKEWFTSYTANKRNFDALNWLYKKLQLVNSYIEFAKFMHKVDTKEIDAPKDFVQKVLKSMNHIVDKKFRLDESNSKHAQELAEYINEKYGVAKLRQMVVEAMELTKGHWYKCKNGHFYAIGECGGAMEESKCPDCGVKIGGTNHNLAEGNLHAGEMDGSNRPAWDPAGFDAQLLRGEVNLRDIAEF